MTPASRTPRPARLAALALSALIAGTALAAASCGDRDARPPGGEAVVQSPEQVSQVFVVTRSEGGRKRWDLRAASGEIYDGGNLVLLTDLTIDFFDSTGALQGTLTAEGGKVLKRENRIEVERNVALRTTDGSRLATDRLAWSEAENRIRTDAYVEIDRDGERLTGYGLEASPDLTFAEVQRSVSVTGTREER